MTIRLTLDLSRTTIEDGWYYIVKVPTENKYLPRILSPGKLAFKRKGKIKIFSEKY